MSPLLHALSQRVDADSLWNDGSAWRTVADVRASVRTWQDDIRGQRLALAFGDDHNLATALLAADGRCESVLLVPASWSQEQLDRYLPLAATDQLITDRNDLSGPTAYGPVVVSPARFETQWIVPTSGTTGEPKLVAHTLTTLTRTVRTDPGKGNALIWGLVYELSRFAGLQVLLQALLGGSRLVFTDRSAGIERTFNSLIAAGCNGLSATPSLWRRLMMAPGAERWPLTRITLGGEVADATILDLLSRRYPSARITHIYASTEAGVGFSVTDGRAGFPAAFLTQPPNGVELQIDAENILWLRPRLTVQRFLGTNQALADRDGWINTGDRVQLEGDRVHFLGRANGAINVGGNKVYPEEVESCIRLVTGVQQVKVQARRNPIMGALVEAIVVPQPDTDRAVLKQSILSHCKARLAPYQVPAFVQWSGDLDVTAAGKLARV